MGISWRCSRQGDVGNLHWTAVWDWLRGWRYTRRKNGDERDMHCQCRHRSKPLVDNGKGRGDENALSLLASERNPQGRFLHLPGHQSWTARWDTAHYGRSAKCSVSKFDAHYSLTPGSSIALHGPSAKQKMWAGA